MSASEARRAARAGWSGFRSTSLRRSRTKPTNIGCRACTEALIENSSDNIALIRGDATTLYQSAAVEQQLGYKPEEVVGRNNFDLVHPDDLATGTDRFGEMLASDDVVGPVRFRARHKLGHWVVLETVGKRFTAEDRTPFAVINTRDITDVVETQKALEATQEQLAHAMKMEAVGRLAGGVAHDFNNLLTVITGYAELIGTTIKRPDPRSDDLDEIKRAAHRASLLTRQLLAFSRKQMLRPEVLELSTVVRDIGGLMQRLIGEDIQLIIETTISPLPVLADRSQLEQVLMNLAVNARDAMPLGGTLALRTAAINDFAHLSVRDTGSGIPPEALGRVFEPFFTTKELGKGTGLGLSTACGIVKQSGGDIQVTSAPGEGTEFTISLPLATQTTRASKPTMCRAATTPFY
ncbi:MAG: sensor histidine kinase [Vicinamibacterales bacterium]